MATILIVDDRPTNREFLVTLLGYGGHRLLEAGDGAEGLGAVRDGRPDLVIADILMPTMDGYEFVRRLRADPAVADTRVIFFTAHYHEPEARRLAAACGVADVLTKPCEPEAVLRTVEAALGPAPAPASAPVPPAVAFDRDHLALLTDKLSRQADEARRSAERLTALVELGLQLGSERDPGRLLQGFCDAAREIVGARYAVVGVPDGPGTGYRHVLTGGMDVGTVARVGRPGPLGGVLGSVLAAGRCFRAGNHGGLEAAGVPASFPPASALLAAPVVSPTRVHGWVCLLDKVGADAFTDEDERFARMLAAQVGRVYENGTLYTDLLRHSSKLAEEVAARERSEAALRESEGRFRGAFEHTGVAMVITDTDNRFVRVNAAFARLFGYTPPEMLGMTMAGVTHPDDLAESLARREDLLAGAEQFFQIEKRYRHRGGHTFWGLTNVSLVRDADGRPILYVGQVQDITERKRAEADLRRTADLLKAVADGTTDAVYVKDRDGKYLMFNEAAARFVGRPVADVLGRDDTVVFDPESARLIRDRDRQVMASGRVETDEETLTAAGVTRTYHATKGPYLDARGTVIGVLGISRDITDRKRAEEELRRSQALLSVASRVGRMGAWSVVLPSGRVEWSEELRAILDLPPGPAPGVEEGLGFYTPEYRAHVTAAFSACVRDGVSFDLEAQVETPRGRRLWVRVIGEAVRDAGGAVVRAQGAFQNISERKQAEETLRLRDRAIEAVALGILITDPTRPDNPIVYANNGFERLTGYTAAEYVGRNGRFLQGKDTDPGAAARVREAIQTGQPCTVEILNYRKGGTPFWNDLSVSPVQDAAGRLTHFVGVQTDVTARRTLEEQFRQSQKMEAVGRLAGGVAHDFNNLLTIINGYGELLLGTLPASDPSRDLIRQMVSAGERAAGLTRQLLAFSRKSIIAPELLDLKAVVADVERMLRRVVGEDVSLAVTANLTVGAVRADRGQIEQVLMNLVVNARDAMPTGGKLDIEVRDTELDEGYARSHPDARPGPHVLLAVADTGCGIDAATLARVFEPFFSTKGELGSGLGLATVHGIVKQGGGHVAVESEVGRGTTFRVYLPRAEAPKAAEASRADRPALPPGGETVLLVEDEDAVRGLTRHVLRDCGYTVLEARDGAEAVRLAGQYQGRIDLLVTDVVMPRMSGREVAQRVAERHAGAKVLFVSGYTDDAVVRHGILEAEVAFLQKPFTPASLAAKVRDVLDSPASCHP